MILIMGHSGKDEPMKDCPTVLARSVTPRRWSQALPVPAPSALSSSGMEWFPHLGAELAYWGLVPEGCSHKLFRPLWCSQRGTRASELPLSFKASPDLPPAHPNLLFVFIFCYYHLLFPLFLQVSAQISSCGWILPRWHFLIQWTPIFTLLVPFTLFTLLQALISIWHNSGGLTHKGSQKSIVTFWETLQAGC